MSHYIPRIDLLKFKESLESRKTELKELINVKAVEIAEKNDFTGDIIDLASQHEKYLSIKIEIERLKADFYKVVEALKNFSDFGYCSSCDEEIGVERLLINPAFERCIDCASLHEHKSKQYIK
jgi:DnaK suppressor protein